MYFRNQQNTVSYLIGFLLETTSANFLVFLLKLNFIISPLFLYIMYEKMYAFVRTLKLSDFFSILKYTYRKIEVGDEHHEKGVYSG